MGVAMLGAGVITLYSIWILVISVAFRAVRVDNLRYLFEAVFEVARWPASVFKGVLAFVFTYVIPIALMTTYPAEALLGTLSWERFVGGWIGALTFAALARFVKNPSKPAPRLRIRIDLHDSTSIVAMPSARATSHCRRSSERSEVW